jgi:hypothetical protein
VQLHIVTCPNYAARFHAQAALPDPVQALAEYRNANTSETRALARDLRLRDRFLELDRRQTAQRARWAAPADLLD